MSDADDAYTAILRQWDRRKHGSLHATPVLSAADPEHLREPMTDTLKAQLAQIDTWLTEEGGGALADVLSAIRGPDDENHVAKEATTAHIRQTAFPKAFAHIRLARWTREIGPFDAPGVEHGRSHFLNHVRWAAYALGLM